MDLFLKGLELVITLESLLAITGGVALGIIFGAMPGLSATMAIALCLPISYGMTPSVGMSLLMGLYVGGISGGLISAILLKIPGTPSSIATCFDGSPMAARGEAGRALGAGIVFSAIGTFFGFLALIFVSPPLAQIALKFGYYEYFAVGIFSLTLIASLSTGSVFKGVASAAFGLVVSLVGAAPIDGYPRFTFGMYQLNGGLNILPVLIGLFAVTEVLTAAKESRMVQDGTIIKYKMNGIFGISLHDLTSQVFNAVYAGVIGIAIGILPGIGGGTSNLLAYAAIKKKSKHPEKFGTGVIDGIVASETANNATIGGALIPLLSLGIPGDTSTAMLLGGLLLHGLAPGPLLFVKNGPFVYGVFIALLVATIVMVALEFAGLKFFVSVLKVPRHILLPIVMVLCGVGAFGLSSRVFDVAAMLFFGIIGMLLITYKFPQAPMILGFVLGPMIETNLRRGLMSSKGSYLPFIQRPIALTFLVVALLAVVYNVYKELRAKHKGIAHD